MATSEALATAYAIRVGTHGRADEIIADIIDRKYGEPLRARIAELEAKKDNNAAAIAEVRRWLTERRAATPPSFASEINAELSRLLRIADGRELPERLR